MIEDIKLLEKKKDYTFKYKFFFGETVRHTGNNKLYTVCDLSNASDDYYGLWLLGTNCAVPTHGSEGKYLESISKDVS